MYISYETMNGCFLQWMLSFSILSRGNGCICPAENVLFFGLRDRNNLVFTGNATFTPFPNPSRSWSQCCGSIHLTKSSFVRKRYLPSSLLVPLLLNRYWKTSCLKQIIVGNILLDARFSKIAAWTASFPNEINSLDGFGFQYVL